MRISANLLLTVAQLRRSDAARLLEFVADAQAIEGPEPVTTDLLDRLAAITESDIATYAEPDVGRGAEFSYVRCSYEARFFPLPASAAHWKPSGFAARYQGEVITWSEHLDRPSRRRFESAPWASYYGVVDRLFIRMRPADNFAGVVILGRHERDFTARDRLIGYALRPHVVALVRQARGRRRLAVLKAAADSADEGDRRGFVILGRGDLIEYASPPAKRLLAAWFGNGLGDRLPSCIGDWLASPSPDQPLQVERSGTRLVVEAPTRGGLIVAEERVRPSLTAREVDVVRALAAGKSTAEIAHELWVTPATVNKHLEHLYRKLGVSSRTAALAAIGARVDALR
jgi:DNA-binding CsgD family transcriptional regulator